MDESQPGALPNAIVIGAGKCGTTSLHYYLGLHPQIGMSREKELNFFLDEFNWGKGIGWYRRNFSPDLPVRGEASPKYTQYPFLRGVPERMHSVVPDAKLVYVLRHPIERAISEYMERSAGGQESRTLEDALRDFGRSPYVCFSSYSLQLEQYLEFYGPSRVLILTQEDLLEDRLGALQRVFRFLNVDDTFVSPKFRVILNRSAHKRRKNRSGLLLREWFDKGAGSVLPLHVRMRIGWLFSLPFSKRIERPVLGEPLRSELADYLRGDIDRMRPFCPVGLDRWSL